MSKSYGILDKLKDNEKLTKFKEYLKNHLFKLDYSLYNYEDIIKLIKDDEDNKVMNKIYFTNNICETINSKINCHLPKKSTNIKDFIFMFN